MSQFKAKPTEYHGTVFRSKSEAIYAKALHNLSLDYVYEPVWACDALDGEWTPDFSVMLSPLDAWLFTVFPKDNMWTEAIIELKPSGVTDTYREQTVDYLSRLVRQSDDGHTPVLGVLSFCNAYTGSTEQQCFARGNRFKNTNKELSVEAGKRWRAAIIEAKDYRFDLA